MITEVSVVSIYIYISFILAWIIILSSLWEFSFMEHEDKY